MVVFSDRVLDLGLASLASETNALFVCSTTTSDYATALSLRLAQKTGTIFGAPEAGGSGRQVAAVAITDGDVLADGSATNWAAVDTIALRLLASGPLRTSLTVVNGGKFTLPTFLLGFNGVAVAPINAAAVLSSVAALSAQGRLSNKISTLLSGTSALLANATNGSVDAFWTVFTETSPSGEGSGFSGAGTRKIYVASAAHGGSDSNTGTQASPKLTLSAGVALLRNGSPDWLMLNKGDVWTDQSLQVANKAGQSAGAPMLIGAYGSGARPQIKWTNAADQFDPGSVFSGNCSNLYVVGLDFYAYKRDPNNPSFVANDVAGENNRGTGVTLSGSGTTFTLEDCKISFYRHNWDCIGTYTTPRLRRCVILDSYDYLQPGGGNVEGVFFSFCQNPLMDECILDGNGHNDQLGHTPIALSHAGYFRQPNNQGNGTTGPGTMTGCWSSRNSADGTQLRRGGTMTKNFFTLNACGFEIGHSDTDGEGSAVTTTGDVSDNVVMRSADVGAGRTGHGMTIDFCQGSGVQIQNNIVAHIHPNAKHTGGGAGAIWAQPIFVNASSGGIVITNNKIFDWATDDNRGVYDNQGSDTITPNEVDLAGTNTFGYSSPNRTAGTYYQSIGGTNDEIALINAVRAQSKDNWNPQLTAKALINYIRSGFDMGPIT